MTLTPPTAGHSRLGASKAHRWFACAGYPALADAAPTPPTSVHAARGTVAHHVASACLEDDLDASEFLGFKMTVDGHDIELDEDDIEAVQVYLDTIRVDAVASGNDSPVRLVEHKFHLHQIHRDLFGTADCVQMFHVQKLLRVYDYKHGSGKAVDVKDNPQLLYYAIGALLGSGVLVKDVEIVIVQPRCPHQDGPVRRQHMPVGDLLDFRADLLEAVARTEAPNAPRTVGDHCQWCECQAICPEMRGLAQAAAKLEFTPTATYDAQLLADTLEQLPVIESWVESVRAFAYGEAERGRTPPGYKLVAKVPRRKWIDAHTTEIELGNIGLGESDIYPERELKSPAQIEKVIGKAKKNADKLAVVNKLCEAKSSGSTLVPLADKRPALKRSAQEDFTHV